MTEGKNIGIDFDGSLCKEVCWTETQVLNATPRKEFIEHVNRLFATNFIVIYTARKDHLLPTSLEWLRRNGVKYHAISNIKIPLEFYVDDKAVHINDIDTL